MDSFEEKMKKIVESQAFAPADALTDIINETVESGELTEDDLHWVSAASKTDFDKFRQFCAGKKQR